MKLSAILKWGVTSALVFKFKWVIIGMGKFAIYFGPKIIFYGGMALITL